MKRAVIVLVAVCLIVGTHLRAQNGFQAIHTFSGNQGRPVAGLMEGPDGRLYGTTEAGGQHGKGSVFVADASGMNVEVLHEFEGVADGEAPLGRLLLASDNNFYGTTSAGGSFGFGTVFRMTPEGTVSTVVHFDGNEHGKLPQSGLIEVGGVLYGTTLNGGTGLAGTVFSLTFDGGLTSIPFDGADQGGAPAGELFYNASDDAIYGTAQAGGSLGAGAIFRLGPDRTTLTSVASFDPEAHGRGPRGGVIKASDGSFYGTTPEDGDTAFGTIFRMSDIGELSTVATFDGNNGAAPRGELREINGYLYGTTREGSPSGLGSVFKLSLAAVLEGAPSIEMVWAFGLLDGALPRGGVIQTATGSIFGTTSSGGDGGFGTLFQITPDGNLTTTSSFTGTAGATPSSQLLEASDGNFYGTTSEGGRFGLGTVFQLTPDGVMTTLVSFNGSNGTAPSGRLVEINGELYGTTETGGFGDGNVYRLNPISGEFTEIAVFDSLAEVPTGAIPRGGLTLASDGNLYGTTEFGPDGFSTVFMLTLDGELTTIASLGDYSTGGVVEGRDAALYGVTEMGGDSGFGGVYRVPLGGGEPMTFASFDGMNGDFPVARPLVGEDGTLYGTTSFGGEFGAGAVYAVSPLGEVSLLASFDGANGANPIDGLVFGSDGKLYGTAMFGGSAAVSPFGSGTLYRVNAGAIDVIHTFDGVTSALPNSTLILASDDAFYGTGEGPLGGTVFRFAVENEDPATLTVAPSSATYGGSASFSANLASSSGPVAGVEIAFALNGVAVGAAITGADGVATLDAVSIAHLDAGHYAGAIHASAAGLGLEASGDLTIGRATPSVSVVGGTFVYDGQPHSATATVTGIGDDVLEAVITYNDGLTAPVEPGAYAVLAAFAGDTNYQPASAEAVLTIQPAPPGVTGLIAAYGFNEGGGDVAADASGRGHHGSIKGADYVSGRFGRALRFDGNNDWVTIADDDELDLRNALTIEAWVNPDRLSYWRTVVIKERSESQAYALYASEDSPEPSGYVNIGGDYKGVRGSRLPIGVWSHVAMTYNGSVLRFYVNGVEVSRRSVTGRLVSSGGPLRIGGNSIWGEFFDGMIDEVRVYGVAITPAEIMRDMHTPVAHEAQPPVVRVVSPLNGDVVSGTPRIMVDASDNVAVASVQIEVDGKVVSGSLANAPYSARLDAANGTHTIRAIARDTAGNMSASDTITVRVANRRVADYRFNEGSGRAVVDASGLGNHGTTTFSGVTRVFDGERGKVLQFNGAGGMVSVPDSSSLDLTTGMTLEAWVKPSAISYWRTVVLKEGVNEEVYSIYANEDVSAPAGYVLIDGEYRAVRGPKRLTLGVWTHLAVTYDGETMRFYVNGEEKDSRTQTGSVKMTNGQLSIGGNTIWGEWFKGNMDDVRIYDVAVGAAQIKTDMNDQ